MEALTFHLEDLRAPCPCGQSHALLVEEIWMEPGALNRLPQVCACGGWKHPTVVCDYNTWGAAGQDAFSLLPDAQLILLDPVNLHADEHGVAAAEAQFPPETDVLFAVGSGTIHDITRYHAFHKHLDFVSVPTAASVDGFVSTVAAMTWEGRKVTFPAVPPRFVVADSNIYAKAPQRLTASGFGDLLGKYTALADWKISHLLTGEHLCQRVYDLTQDALAAAVDVRAGIAAGDPESCARLMYGLLLSGLAMQMMGSSRPASGCEHHMSHFWEMGVAAPPPDAYHGEKVGVGLLLCAAEYASFSTLLKSGHAVPVDKTGLTARELREGVRDPELYQGLVEENTPDPLEAVSGQLILSHKDEICKILDTVPRVERLRDLLRSAGGKTTVEELGLDPSIIPVTKQYSPYVRNRLTVLRLKKLVQSSD